MKRISSIFLNIIMILSVISPIFTFAVNGPHPSPENSLSSIIENKNFENLSAILFYGTQEGSEFSAYPIDNRYAIPEKYKKAISYDMATNTLFLKNLKNDELSLNLIDMGDDFKIHLTGYNEILSVLSTAYSRGGSITITGDGELVLGRNREILGEGLSILSQGTKSVLTIDKNVKLKSYAYDDGDNRVFAVNVNNTTAKDPIVIKGSHSSIKPQKSEYVNEVVKTYKVHDVANSATAYYDAGFTTEADGEKKLYIGYKTDVSGKYTIYSLSYDSQIDLYVLEEYNNGKPTNPVDFGLSKVSTLPIKDEKTGFYIGNPEDYTEFDESVTIKNVFFDNKPLDMKICTDKNGKEYAYIQTESFNENETVSLRYNVYDLIKTEKYGFVAKENIDITSFSGFTPIIEKSENSCNIYYCDDVIVNNGGAIVEPSAVKNIKAVNGVDCIEISFSAVKNAERYKIYVYNNKKSVWVYKASFKAVESPRYKIKNVNTDTKYKFLVVAENFVGATVKPPKSSTVQIMYRNASKVAYEVNSNGNKIKWYRHKSGKNYRVYRQTYGDNSWVKLADTKSINFTDKTAKYGIKYRYAVRTFFNDNTYTAARSTPYITRVAKADVKSAVNNPGGGVKVTWGKTKGAEGYKVYRKTSKSKWKLLANIQKASATSFVDKTAKSGTTYTYTVRAYNKFSSGTYEPGVTIKALSTPKITLQNKKKGICISWNKVAGANIYRVYRKLSGTSKWTILKDTKSLSFTDTTAVPGKKYEYTVKATSNGYWSSNSGKSIVRKK